MLRENTERAEAIECGVARHVGEDPASLRQHLADAATDVAWFAHCRNVKNPFGDGKASQRIASAAKSLIAKK